MTTSALSTVLVIYPSYTFSLHYPFHSLRIFNPQRRTRTAYSGAEIGYSPSQRFTWAFTCRTLVDLFAGATRLRQHVDLAHYPVRQLIAVAHPHDHVLRLDKPRQQRRVFSPEDAFARAAASIRRRIKDRKNSRRAGSGGQLRPNLCDHSERLAEFP